MLDAHFLAIEVGLPVGEQVLDRPRLACARALHKRVLHLVDDPLPDLLEHLLQSGMSLDVAIEVLTGATELSGGVEDHALRLAQGVLSPFQVHAGVLALLHAAAIFP